MFKLLKKIKCFLGFHEFNYEKRNVEIVLTKTYTAKKVFRLRKCANCKKHQRLNMPFSRNANWTDFKYGDAKNFTAKVIVN